MINREKRFYTTFRVLCTAGYLWIGYAFLSVQFNLPQPVCLFKAVTAVPCPACGSTHAVQALFAGDVFHSVAINPLGLLSAIFLLVIPVWMVYDFILDKSGFFNAYCALELQLKKRNILIMVIITGCLNWIWNIYKNV